MNYFSLFGLPICYKIDINLLSSIFQNLQRKYHPDKFVNNNQIDQKAALEYSSIINQAWQTLCDPILRAEYLLSLHGFNYDYLQKSIQDKSFLIEQLSLREELDNLEQIQDKIQLEIFINRIKCMFNNHQKQLAEKLKSKQWDQAMNIIHKLRFFDKLYKNAESLEEKLFNFN